MPALMRSKGQRTLLELGQEKLGALCEALGFGSQAREIGGVFAAMAVGWGDRPAGAAPPHASDITDDHTPYEFSLAIDGREPELRFLIEAQGGSPSLAASWEAARRLNAALARRFGVSLGRLEQVEDLFAPTDPAARFGLWHAVCFRRGAAPDFKVYLNPAARGRERAPALVKEALARVGLGEAFAALPLHRALDEIKYISLDLSARREARVKVYTAHPRASVRHIEEAVRMARDHAPGQAAEFCRAMGGGEGPYAGMPVLTCLAFTGGEALPATGTIHFPVRAYADDDRAARDRILAYLPGEGARIYRDALEVFASRRLEDGIGMQTYASLREQRGSRRVTVYLAPEVYSVRPARALQPRVPSPLAPAPRAERAAPAESGP